MYDIRPTTIPITQKTTTHATKIEAWFNIITPKRRTLATLKNELAALNAKDWLRILSA